MKDSASRQFAAICTVPMKCCVIASHAHLLHFLILAAGATTPTKQLNPFRKKHEGEMRKPRRKRSASLPATITNGPGDGSGSAALTLIDFTVSNDSLLDKFCRVSSNYGPGRDILDDNGPCANHGTLPNLDVRPYKCVRTNPYHV